MSRQKIKSRRIREDLWELVTFEKGSIFGKVQLEHQGKIKKYIFVPIEEENPKVKYESQEEYQKRLESTQIYLNGRKRVVVCPNEARIYECIREKSGTEKKYRKAEIINMS